MKRCMSGPSGLKPNALSLFYRDGNPAVGRWSRNCIFFCVLLLSFVRCESPFESTAGREFVIPAGEHYATPRLHETFGEQNLAFKATFDGSAQYDLKDPSLQSNLNKLMGFSDCHSMHHANSARFAWRWYSDRLEIHAYCYVDSVRVMEYIGSVNLHEENRYEIRATANEYVFFIDGERKTAIDRTTDCDPGLNYMLYPYFGGSAPAPHDVRVKVELLNN